MKEKIERTQKQLHEYGEQGKGKKLAISELEDDEGGKRLSIECPTCKQEETSAAETTDAAFASVMTWLSEHHCPGSKPH